MIEYLRFKIKNGKTFKEAEFPLKDLGVVAIQGKNGVGKSSLWDLLQVMHYGKTPGDNPCKKDELVRNQNNAEWELEFNKDGKHYTINYSRKKHGTEKKSKWKYAIIENGEDITAHNQQIDVPKQLLEIIGLSQKEYEGSVHLTQGGQHVLIKGKPKDRKDYISSFFGLDERYDHVLDHAKSKLKTIKEEIDRVSSFDHAKIALETEIKDINVPDVSNSQKTLDKLAFEVTGFNNQLALLKSEGCSHALYEKLSPLAFSVENPSQKLTDLQNEASRINTQLEQQIFVNDFNLKAGINNDKLDGLNRQLSSIVITVDGSLEELNNEYYSLQAHKQRNFNLQSTRTEYTSLPQLQLIDLVEAEKTVNKLKLAAAKAIDKLNAIKNGECSTCGHKYASEDVDQTYAQLTSTNSDLGQWEKYCIDAKINNDSCNRKTQLGTILAGTVEYTDTMEERRVELAKQLPILTQKLQIERDISNTVHQELMPKVDTSNFESDLLNNQNTQGHIKSVIDALSKCPPKPNKTLQELQKEEASVAILFNSTTAEIEKLKAELAVAEERKYRKAKIQKQIDDLKKELSHLESLKKKEFLWSKLVEAYGPKGLRLVQLNKVMNLLMERLPFFTGFLFSNQNMEFYHKCDAGNISIMLRRKDEEGAYDVDVSQMSGGESKRLAVSLVLALASCVPTYKRTNILILDEVDGQLDSDGRYLFSNLLSSLKDDYNSIFITSHSETINQADIFDKVWYFTKPERSHYTLVDMRSI